MNEQIQEVARLFSKEKDEQLIYQFLECWFTPAEMEDMGKRWALIKLLHEGKTQRLIASQLGVSLCKITRGSKELQKPDSIFKQFIMQLKKGAFYEQF